MKTQRAFSLVEIAMVISITAFCVLAVLGLLPIGLTSNQAAIQQTTATNLLASITADLRSTPATSGTSSPRFNINMNGSTGPLYFKDEATKVLSLSAGAIYRVDVTLTAPASGNRSATQGSVVIRWPAAAASAQNAAGSVESFVALDRN